MKKRMLSWLLALALAAGMLPAGALAAGAVEIADQAGLEAIRDDPGGSYVLTGDVELTGDWVPISTFSGTLDGGGHAIRGLQVSGSLSEAGLFASLGAGAEVRDLTLEGCAVSSSSYSANVGALAGRVTGSGVTITNVGLQSGTVSATGSSAYCGGLVGNMTYGPTFTGCFNAGTVSGANRTGGLVGGVTGSARFTDCYATGPVTATGGYAGGLFGYGYIYSTVTLTNCYAAAPVDADRGYGLGYTGGGASYWKLENCYWDSELCAAGTYNVSGGLTGLSTAETQALASALGEGFQDDAAGLNGGYPILAWQYTPDPSSTWTVTLTVEPAAATLTWDGEAQALDPDGVYTFENVPYASEHSWSAAYDEGDYAPQSGVITVKKDISQVIALSPNLHALTFDLTPADAALTVTDAGGETLEPTGENAYTVPKGTYNYTAAAFGYADAGGTVAVGTADAAQAVALSPLPAAQVAFVPGDLPQGGGAVGPNPMTLTTADGLHTISGTGLDWALPVGYAYTYTFKSPGYQTVTGTLDLTAAQGGEAQSVAIPLTLRTAWDGVTTEQPQGDGTAEAPYEITCGEELAWLSNYVNQSSSNGAQANAVLTKDVDLGDNPWIPMGNSYSVKYKSVFDGRGHTVSGLNVQGGDYAGLFGQVEKATIQNLVVQGAVTGTGRTAGVVGYAYGDCIIQNCGNEAAVTGTGSWTGGVVGYIGSYYDTGSSITGCYNAGTVTGQGSAYNYAGGVLGYDYAGADVTFTDCYNVGAVTSSGYAGGVRAYGSSMAGALVNCYNAGTVTGADESKTGAIAPGSASTVTNCYYLDTGTDGNSGSASRTAVELQQADFLALLSGEGQAWKQDGAMNGGYPVLAWQKAPAPPPAGEDYVLAPSEFIWFSATDPDTGEAAGEITPYLQWEGVPGAAGYTLTLWNQCYRPAGEGYERLEERAVTLQNIAGEDVASLPQDQGLTLQDGWLYFDLTGVLSTLGDGRYHATVTPAGEAVPDLAYVQAHIFGVETPYNRLAPVTGLAWDGTRATWTPKAGFGAEDGYAVTVYRLDDQGSPVPVHVQSVPGNYSRVDCSGTFAVGGRYVFSVSALACHPNMEAFNYTDSLDSRRSDDPLEAGDAGVYTVSQPQRPDGTRDESWVAISTPEAWIDLANVEDVDAIPDDPESNLQAVAWGKKYYLTADLDFSALSPEYAAKTRSIGNVTHRFLGTLDGNGHKLLGLTLSGGECGLFEYIGSTGCVYDLTVAGANMLASDNAGIVANNNYGTIDRCAVLDSNIVSDTGAVIGGMVSRNYGLIRESYVQGGVLTANSATATGHGGFAGANERGGRIQRCWTNMEVKSQSDYAGGFVGLGYGETGNPATIRDCFALGNVSARGYAGGFVGRSVYEDCRYENCYAAGTVTVTDAEGHGFIGGNKPGSAFQYDQSQGISNCYYNAASPADANCPGGGKTLAEMATAAFAQGLNTDEEIWLWAEDVNGGLPYLKNVAPPASPIPETMTVTVVLATYDKETYTFVPFGGAVSVTLESGGNTRVSDVLDAAQAQGLLTYAYTATPTLGRFIHTINGYAVSAPDGWMFTINDTLSNVSASLATVADGDVILWFEGTTENRFLPPTLASLADSKLTWEDVDTVSDLLALANSAQAEGAGLLDAGSDALGKNYRLTADLDLAGVDFPGIGSLERPFTGVFNGQGHTIANMTRRGTDNVGFVNVLRGGTVKDLRFENVTVEGQSNVGAVVGWSQADVGDNVASLVGSCAVRGGRVTGTANVGGVVGRSGADADRDGTLSVASSVDKCAADVAVSGSGEKIGGLVGANEGNVTACAATGQVDAPEAAMVGGLVGDNPGSIYGSHAAGAVSGGNVVGGLIGSSAGSVQDSYALGNVAAQGTAGGFAGTLSAADTVLSAGTVTAPGGYVGALAGTLNGKLTGAAAQINVKNAFANCAGGLSVVGNTSQFTADALEGLKLAGDEAVADKLLALFGVDLDPNVPPAPTVDREALMDAIAAKLATSSDPWAVMDMARYSALPGKTAATTGAARQAALDALIAQAADPGATVSNRTLVEIAARSMGVDSKELYPAGTQAAVNNAQRLADMDLTSGGCYSAPWVLLAARQGNVQLTQAQTDALIGLLADSAGDGLFGYTYDGVFYSDPDTACITLAALAPYGDERSQALREKILSALPTALNGAGSLGNANSDAMAILGLLAVGEDPAELGLVDGLLGYVNETGDGFLYNGAENFMATEQGFRALVALAMFDGSDPVSFYDFSAVAVWPGYAAGAEGPDKPTPPSPPSGGETITVQFTLKTDTETWIPTANLTLSQGATVADALAKAASTADVTVSGLETGYIKSMTKGGVTLAEFDKGPNSGWLYQVNGAAPGVPFNSYTLKDGDSVLWYYAADWTQDPAASRPVSGGSSKRDEPKEDEPEDKAPSGWPFGDVGEGAWYYDSVKTVCDRGLMVGTGEGRFGPDDPTSRAMIATVLWRLAGEPEAGTEATFADVPDGQWYTQAVNWASRQGIVTGTGEGFAPDRDITRQELVTLLYRYAQPGGAAAGALTPYRDADQVAPWAVEAMAWAVETGVLTGKPGNLLDPQGGATRAQVAAVLDRWLTGKKGPAPAADPALDDAISAAGAYLLRAVPTPQVGAVGGEWTVLALARSGLAPETYLADYRTAAEEYVAEKKGVLDERKYTEYSRLVLALTALGVDARDVSGYDLTAPLSDCGKVTRQGLNGAAWALIALDSGNYPAPDGVRQQYLDLLLSRQLPGGGWSLTGTGDMEADVTAMALQALAGYRDQDTVAQATDKALTALSAQQNADGSFSTWGTANAESCAQVIVALEKLGVPLDDPRFVKNGHTALDGLLTFALPDGGFAHALGEDANLMATEQALYALAAARAGQGN